MKLIKIVGLHMAFLNLFSVSYPLFYSFLSPNCPSSLYLPFSSILLREMYLCSGWLLTQKHMLIKVPRISGMIQPQKGHLYSATHRVQEI